MSDHYANTKQSDTTASRHLAAQPSQEQTTAQRYREHTTQHTPQETHGTLRSLDDGCQACNMSKVWCDAIWHKYKHPCCTMCGHP